LHLSDARIAFAVSSNHLLARQKVEQKAHFPCLDPSQSDNCFVVPFSAKNTGAFPEGHTRPSLTSAACRRRCSTTTGARRRRIKAYRGVQWICNRTIGSRLSSAARIRRRQGNMEVLVSYALRNFMMPVSRAADSEELNPHWNEECPKRRAAAPRSSE
jgi:hypothetical protein